MSQATEEDTAEVPDKYTPDRTRKEQIQHSIQSAAEQEGEPLSRADYNRWRQQQNEKPLSASTITRGKHYDSWESACNAADVTPRKTT